MIATPRPAPATLEMPSDTEIVITREFNAPRALVWDAFSKPEHIRRWWGLRGTTVPVCENDLRVGGTWRWVLRDPDGSEHAFSGKYLEVAPPERAVRTEWYEAIPDAEYVSTATFTERDGKTLLHNHLKYKSREHRDGHLMSGMEPGMQETYQRMDELLEELTHSKP